VSVSQNSISFLISHFGWPPAHKNSNTITADILCHIKACLVMLSMCDLAKIIFTSKFSYLLFCNPSHKSETGIANRWGTSNSEPPGPIIMMGRSETLTSIEIILLHTCVLLAQLLGLVSHYKMCHYAEPRLFSSPKPAYFDFSSSNGTGRVTYWAPLEML
jgi:hypothetical protein